MKTSELEGSKLAEWVARANGWDVVRESGAADAEWICWNGGDVHSFGAYGYRPEMNWAQGGPLIERERIAIEPVTGSLWSAEKWVGQPGTRDGHVVLGYGATPLEAAMRALVDARFGHEVPDEVPA